MRRMKIVMIVIVWMFCLVSVGAEDEPLQGFTRASSATERQWETKFRAIPSPDNQREYMRRLSARPHHVGSPYDKENAEWILSKFKEWGWDAHIETFDVLFPTPKERVLEMVEPRSFTAKLQEPPVAVDPTVESAERATAFLQRVLDRWRRDRAAGLRELRSARRITRNSTAWAFR